MEEANTERGLDSPSRNSYIGSYYQPPDRMMYLPRRVDFPFQSVVDSDSPTTSPHVSQPKSNIDSKAVVDALKTLQEKIRRIEAETSRHSEKCQEVTYEAQKQPSFILSPLTTHNQNKKEHDGIIKCRILQNHLEKTKRTIEKAKKEHNTLLENQSTLQKEQFNTNIQLQKEKLERLESEYEKLSRTQSLAEMKLTMLEEKLQKEEHERKLVQEKAEELQREFDNTRRMSPQETKIKNKTKKIKNKEKKTLKQNEKKSPIRFLSQKMPFVAGMSTSPSHSVHANVQSVLHMMKHHQPQLHEQVSLHRSVGGARKNLQKDTFGSVLQRHSESSESEESLGSLSDLLLALQDELGQMSFEHRELMHQIDSTHDHKNRQDLKNELERLVTKMDEKGAQITKLRKHQQMIHKMAESQKLCGETLKSTTIHPPAPSPVKPTKRPQKQPSNNLQLLRETQQFRNSLKQSDLFWET